jgi:hypothetical protein
MKKLLLFLSLIVSFVVSAQAQMAKDSLRSHAFSLGIGSSHQLDTYLSPQNYDGMQITLMRETLRMTRLAERRISFQTLWQGTFSHTSNASNTTKDWGGMIAYDAFWHYNWTPTASLRLMAGAGVGGELGFLYNTHGGNNPAQGRLAIDLSASAMAIYRFHLGQQPFALRYQAYMPVLGVMFSPQFGQSYYEIGQGKLNHNVCLSQPANAFSLWQQITLDVTLGKNVVLRTGYLCDIRQSHVNNIKVHNRSHSFLIGFVRYFRLMDKKQAIASSLIL